MNETKIMLHSQAMTPSTAFRRGALRIKAAGLVVCGMLRPESAVDSARRFKRIAELVAERHMSRGVKEYYGRFGTHPFSPIHENLRKAVCFYEKALGIEQHAFMKPKLAINSQFDKETTLRLLLELAECKRMFPFHASYAIGDARKAYSLALELSETPEKQAEIRASALRYYTELAAQAAGAAFSIMDKPHEYSPLYSLSELPPGADLNEHCNAANAERKEEYMRNGLSYFAGAAYTSAAIFETDRTRKSGLYLKAFECFLLHGDAISLVPAFRNAVENLHDPALEHDVRRKALFVVLKDAEEWARGHEFADAGMRIRYGVEIYGDGSAFQEGGQQKLLGLWKHIKSQIGDDPEGIAFAELIASHLGPAQVVPEKKAGRLDGEMKQLQAGRP